MRRRVTRRRTRDHDGDDRELAELDAHVEAEERGRDVLLGHAELEQRGRKAEPVQQAEREGDGPGRPPRERVAGAQALGADQHDGQRDRRLDGRRRDVHEPEHREREADAVGDGERGDGGERAAGPPPTRSASATTKSR